ncbi:hypothetical protein [Enterovirga aerilata]|uniref:Uncharacterized protein n=1 Tax=Enterovirga aerilata TaxID=2730920 RepID=A0A849I9G3_9HYPH|nr:hypothetical protein [Enterovirga sp. DB1703]NNM72720.1 hypothetical protein [Enterovirga sp. DB1703]
MHIIETNTYRRLVEALSQPRPDPLGDVTDHIKLCLGEIGDVWPATISDDVAGDEAAT